MRYQRDIGQASWRQSLQVAWWLMQYTLGVVNAERVAEEALRAFRGKREAWMIESCEDWFRDYVLEHVCDAGRDAVRQHQSAGDVVAIVTGATAYAARPLARELAIDHVVCTELEVDPDGCFTGRVSPPMCYGVGKIARLSAIAAREEFRLEEATFYSDSITDLPLLERVATPVVVNPDARLRRVAARRGWRIERW